MAHSRDWFSLLYIQRADEASLVPKVISRHAASALPSASVCSYMYTKNKCQYIRATRRRNIKGWPFLRVPFKSCTSKSPPFELHARTCIYIYTYKHSRSYNVMRLSRNLARKIPRGESNRHDNHHRVQTWNASSREIFVSCKLTPFGWTGERVTILALKAKLLTWFLYSKTKSKTRNFDL